MCMGKAMQAPQQMVRKDPTIDFNNGNILDPKASPVEIDKTPVIATKKVKNTISSQSSGLNITTDY